MPHDPVLVEETRAWFHKAAGDLRAAAHDLTGDPPLLEDAVFHCQQAIEKAFKGFLVWHDHPFRKTHNLEEIGETCLAIDRSLKRLVDSAVPLTEYAWKFRYPGEPEELNRQEVDEALATAREVFEALLNRLPREVRP